MSIEDYISEGLNALASQAVDYEKTLDILAGRYYPREMGISIPPEARPLRTPSDAPRLAVEVLSEVLKISGFRVAPDGSDLEGTADEQLELNKTLTKWWNVNRLSHFSRLAINEALAHGTSYMVTGVHSRYPDTPRITVHPRKDIAVIERDLDGVHAALHVFDRDNGEATRAMLYTDEMTYELVLDRHSYSVVSATETPSGTCAVVEMRNEVYLGDEPRREFDSIMSLADAESRTLTQLQLGEEILAWPQRFLFGNFGKEGPFVGANGEQVDPVKAYLGTFITGPADAKAGTFTQADLTPIHDTLRLYRLWMSASTGIPPSLLGVSADTPTSAEAMRASKERLISLGETKQVTFGDAVEEVLRRSWENLGNDPEELINLETVWRDIASASVSARNASIMAAHQQGVVGGETAREFLDLTPEQRARERMREENELSAISWDADYGLGGERPTGQVEVPEERDEDSRQAHAKEHDLV